MGRREPSRGGGDELHLRSSSAFSLFSPTKSPRDRVSMGESARRTPRELLTERGALADDIIAVQANGEIVDLHTPIDPNADFKPIRATDKARLQVSRHSAAYVMAAAGQRY